MAERTVKVPQTSQDVLTDNNASKVVGIEGLPIQNPNTPGGVFFVDPNAEAVQCLPLGGEASGTPDNVVLNPSTTTISTILNKLIWERSGDLVYDHDNTLTLER